MALTAYQEDVINILSESAVKHIAFAIENTVAVSTRSFALVQTALRQGKINVLSASLAQDALFSRDTQTIQVNDKGSGAISKTASMKALILHECVHIYTYLTNPNLALGDDEAEPSWLRPSTG